ncbi:MAG: hypothetical protein CMH52_09105 [Myxococcales bacterium]|nr:hypothetical protein [Myxococcales bacterium]
MKRMVICSLLLCGLAGCSKDPAKVLEAKSMAICGCETMKCVELKNAEFKTREEQLDASRVTDAQRERAAIAGEKLSRCIERIGKTDPAGQ